MEQTQEKPLFCLYPKGWQSLFLSEHSEKSHLSVESVSLIQLPSSTLPLTGLEEGSGAGHLLDSRWAFTRLAARSFAAPWYSQARPACFSLHLTLDFTGTSRKEMGTIVEAEARLRELWGKQRLTSHWHVPIKNQVYNRKIILGRDSKRTLLRNALEKVRSDTLFYNS